jgi:hypothetical protein
MTALEQLEKDSAIEETDIVTISGIIMHVIEAKNSARAETVISGKETILDSLTDILEKMLVMNINLSKQDKVEIIHLLNKLKANKEYIQIVKDNLKGNKQAFTDIQAASERLGKKSQSAFELDL